VILLKKVIFVDEFMFDSFEELLLMQNKYLLNDIKDIFFFRIINYKDGTFKLKVFSEEL